MFDVSINESSIKASACTVGLTSDFLKSEILRVRASRAEVRSALAFVQNEASLDPWAYEALSPRIRRLVDLIAVADRTLPEELLKAPMPRPSGI